MKLMIKADDLKQGKPIGVSFRTGAHIDRKRTPKRESGKNWRDYVPRDI